MFLKSTSRVRGLGLITIAVVALSGCAPAATQALPTTSPSPTHSATAPPTPTKPALADLVVAPDGLGYLVVGQPVPNAPAASAILSYDPAKCVDPTVGKSAGSPGAGAWRPTYPNVDSSPSSFPPFDVGAVNGPTEPIGVIEIWSPRLLTAKRIGVGSTVAQLTAAYGSSLVVDTADNSDVYVLSGTRSKLLFEVVKAGFGYPASELGTVVWMRIVPLDDRNLHIANSEAAGLC